VSDLQIHVHEGAAIVEIALDGEMDFEDCAEAQSVLEAACDGRSPEVVIDLSRLEFLDSSGIRVLLRAAEAATRSHTKFSVRAPTEAVEYILDSTAVTPLLFRSP
jgi:anti-sigma B factor antagonist